MKRALVVFAALAVAGGVLGAPAATAEAGVDPWAQWTEVSSIDYASGSGSELGGTGAVVWDGDLLLPGGVVQSSTRVAAVREVGDSDWTTLSDPTRAADYPAVAADGQGGAWAVWIDSEMINGAFHGNANVVRVAQASSRQQGWSGPSDLSSPGTHQQGSQRIVVRADGDVSVLWKTWVYGTQYTYTVRSHSSAGWGPPITTPALDFPHAAVLPNGTVVVMGGEVGASPKTLVATTFTEGDSAWSSPIAMANTPVPFADNIHSLQVVGSEVYVVLTSETALSSETWPVYKFSQLSFTFVREMNVGRVGTDGVPQFFPVGDGTIALWLDRTAGDASAALVWSQVYSNGNFTEPAVLDSDPQYFDVFPVRATPDRLGGLRVVWAAIAGQMPATIRYSRYSPVSGWETPVDVGEPSPSLSSLDAILDDGSGGFSVVAQTYTDVARGLVFHANGSLPVGDWPTCTTSEQEMCIESALIRLSGSASQPLSGYGLAVDVSTLPGETSSFNWSVRGAWDSAALPDGFDPAVLEGEVQLAIRTGAWRPRYTTSLARHLSIYELGDEITGHTMYINGSATRIDWNPELSSCGAVSTPDACGDDSAVATEAGSGWRFMGNTQDMSGSGWSEADRVERGGFYVATDAQGGPHINPLALQFLTYPERVWTLTLGNPHRDIHGDPVRGTFTAVGSSAAEAVATGFSIVSVEGGVETLIEPSVQLVRGGVLISLLDFGYSVRTLTVRNEPVPPPSPPGAPTEVTAVPAGAQKIRVQWSPPTQGGVVDAYTARAFLASSGGLSQGLCQVTPPTTTCDISFGLDSNTSYYVDVFADNLYGETESTPRVMATTLPAVPVLTFLRATSTSAVFSFTAQPGVTYTPRATSGGSAIPPSRITMTGTTTRTVTISGLRSNAEVSASVTADNTSRNGGSVTSVGVAGMTLLAKPAKVTGLTFGKVNKGKVTMTWNAVPTTGVLVEFRYRWKVRGAKTWGAWVTTITRKASLSGWVKGKSYDVQIQARNSSNRGDGEIVTSTIKAT